MVLTDKQQRIVETINSREHWRVLEATEETITFQCGGLPPHTFQWRDAETAAQVLRDGRSYNRDAVPI